MTHLLRPYLTSTIATAWPTLDDPDGSDDGLATKILSSNGEQRQIFFQERSNFSSRTAQQQKTANLRHTPMISAEKFWNTAQQRTAAAATKFSSGPGWSKGSSSRIFPQRQGFSNGSSRQRNGKKNFPRTHFVRGTTDACSIRDGGTIYCPRKRDAKMQFNCSL